VPESRGEESGAALQPDMTEDSLRHVIETIPALVLSADPDGSVNFVNRHWSVFTGVQAETLLGLGWRKVLHPDDVHRFVEEWRAARAAGEPFENEARVRRGDGEYRWFRLRKAPLRDESGAIVRWYGTGHDIEDLKQAEERLRLVIDTTPAMLHSARPDGYLDYFNKRWLDYLGVPLEDVRGWNWTSFIHPEDLELILSRWRSALATGEPFEVETRVPRADGEYRWMFHRKVPLRDRAGNVVKWFGSSVDIEDRKRAECALTREKVFLEEAQRVSRTGSFGWEVASGELVWSDETFRIFGHDHASKPTLQSVLSRVHPEDLAAVQHQIDNAFRDAKGFDLQHRLLMSDGTIKHVHVVVHPAPTDAGNFNFVGAITDVTEQHEARSALEKAFEEIKELKDRLHTENVALKEEIDQTSMFEEIVGVSAPLRAVLAQVSRVAPTDSTVLINGETGTGKELVARAIHKTSRRSDRALVSVNCAAIPPSLIASELFGHEKGAFTGALQRRQGRFELADGGSIFLDEVSELPAETQISLLRVLQEREFERVGGSRPIRTDVRVIAASNRDLEAAVARGDFRADLFYRLNVFPLELPALRDRREDIPLLVEYFIHRYARRMGKKIRGIEKSSLELLRSYDWPGNVRELQNVVERAVILCERGTLEIDETWLQRGVAPESSTPYGRDRPADTLKREIIERALTDSHGRVSGPRGAAVRLGIPRSTLESRIRSLGIPKHRFKEG
jgi:PAS domain S-box-containing protein